MEDKMEGNKNITENKEEIFISDYFNSLKRFVLCRTKPIGPQRRGYVLLDASMPSADEGAVFPDTVWIEDNDKKYQQGDVYPLPPDETA